MAEMNEAGGAAEATSLIDAQMETETQTAETAKSEAQPTEQAQTEIAPEDMPITEWNDAILELAEDAAIDPEVVASFGKAAVELGLSSKQAKALAGWQMQAIADGYQAHFNAQKTELEKLWGKNGKANQAFLQANLKKLGEMKGFEHFGEALARSGAANNAVIVDGLFRLFKLMGEDGGAQGFAATVNDGPETALEGIRRVFAEAKARQ